jgi:hypothetical protein
MGKEAKIKAATKAFRHPGTTTPDTMRGIYHLSPRNFRRMRARTNPPTPKPPVQFSLTEG